MSVTLPEDVAAFLNRRAAAHNNSLPKTILAIMTDTMEDDDDPITPEEEAYLVERAEQNRKKSEGKRLYTHQEAWGL